MRRLRHPNIISLVEALDTAEQVSIKQVCLLTVRLSLITTIICSSSKAMSSALRLTYRLETLVLGGNLEASIVAA